MTAGMLLHSSSTVNPAQASTVSPPLCDYQSYDVSSVGERWCWPFADSSPAIQNEGKINSKMPLVDKPSDVVSPTSAVPNIQQNFKKIQPAKTENQKMERPASLVPDSKISNAEKKKQAHPIESFKQFMQSVDDKASMRIPEPSISKSENNMFHKLQNTLLPMLSIGTAIGGASAIKSKQELERKRMLATTRRKKNVLLDYIEQLPGFATQDTPESDNVLNAAWDLANITNPKSSSVRYSPLKGSWRIAFTTAKDAQTFTKLGATGAIMSVEAEGKASTASLTIEGPVSLSGSGKVVKRNNSFVEYSFDSFRLGGKWIPLRPFPFRSGGSLQTLYADDDVVVAIGAQKELVVLTSNAVESADSIKHEEEIATSDAARFGGHDI